MIVLKKRNLIIILILALLLGVVGMAIYDVAHSKITDEKSISALDYEEYQNLKKSYGKLDELKKLIGEKYYIPIDEDRLYEGIYKGLFSGIEDPYSSYLTKREYENLMIAASGEYEGIGVTIAPDKQGFINVVAPMEDSPAFKAGIKSEDKIIEVDGTEYSGDTIDAAASAMRGKKGTSVKIKVLRGREVIDFQIKRANIVMETVKSEIISDTIGYIRISGFEKNTAKDFIEVIRDFEIRGLAGLIIDLRDNPGGLVDVSVTIADSLLPEGIITYTEDRKKNKNYYKSDANATKIPYVILINGASASASEIVAGAVKGNQGGAIVGTQSYGKGIIQEIVPLQDGDATKLTIMQYFSPKGDRIHEKGIEPDYVVELREEDYVDGVLPRENDRQLNKALELLKN